jgi:hypothetical protein
MSETTRITQEDYLLELAQYPERGHVVIVRVTNSRAMPLDFLLEPLGDQVAALQPGSSYDVVAQAPPGEWVFNIEVGEDNISIWLISPTGTYGEAFLNGVSVAPFE